MSEQTEMRMDAYYYGFDRTGCDEVDKILSAVAHAGKSFHHTEQWNENAHTAEYLTGNTPNDWIQNAANEAAQTIADLRARLKRVEEERDRLKHRLELATNAYLAHKDKDAVELKKALAAQEAELDRYKRAVEPVVLVLKRVAAIIKGTDTEHVVVNYPERPQKGLLELVNETIMAVRSLGEDSPKAESGKEE